MKKLLLIFFFLSFWASNAQSEKEAETAILAVLKSQEIAWSQNDLEGFMQGYWKNDSSKFFGGNGLTKGWEQTLKNYQKNYPTKEHSGKLTFKIQFFLP